MRATGGVLAEVSRGQAASAGQLCGLEGGEVGGVHAVGADALVGAVIGVIDGVDGGVVSGSEGAFFDEAVDDAGDGSSAAAEAAVEVAELGGGEDAVPGGYAGDEGALAFAEMLEQSSGLPRRCRRAGWWCRARRRR
jgi:hypothetical protein